MSEVTVNLAEETERERKIERLRPQQKRVKCVSVADEKERENKRQIERKRGG